MLNQPKENNNWDLQLPQSSVRFQGTFMPDFLKTNFNYDFIDYALVSATTSGLLKVAGNSLFDPDKTGSGHQPLGFDALGGAIYQNYRVLSSTITVTLLRTSEACTMCVTPTTNNSYPSTLNDALEARYNSQMIIPTSVFKSQSINSISTHKIWGVSAKTVMVDDLYQAVYTSDPNRIWYWIVQAGVFDGSTGFSLRVNIKITYEAILYNLAIYTQS